MFFKKPGGNVEYMIVGLGNPGDKYSSTRHNAGFMFLDRLLKRCGSPTEKLKFRALYSLCDVKGSKCLILRPQTFMNDSGLSVAEAARFYKIPPERIIVVFDDISLEPGHMRIRRKGSDGGHNGIKSIIAMLDSEDFPRIKIGVGAKPNPEYDLADWVLSRFTKSEIEVLSDVLERACDAAEVMVSGDIDGAMSRFNG